MTQLFRIAGLCGALRKDSFNMKLLLEAKRLAPAGATVEIIDWSELPIYNGDLEAQPPKSVLEFKEKIASCDAILIATPEYNFSYPGAFKNAIDWASRPLGTTNAFAGKAIAMMSAGPGAYPGSSGGHRAQLHLQQVFSILDTHLVSLPMICVTGAGSAFEESTGKLINEHTLHNIELKLENLIKLTKKLNGSN
ncbi:FMN-reductase [Basidiobolus meristosporus CBS 931.73]|uniref:FMN-reductase n=1 Tax=Basidiobolus meristosporus CBS 931.73 TaxID=1314790 RepID=A0A1Y1X9G5_9FUNG|nr:FMN-reductase [Basidiobolus meristosporus CBS 931.73]|eukprot:ORX82400.1 FMN-reductase [Basidiobolus meristosporus CBS 931.73]